LNIVLIGIPGSGKGTQAKLLAKELKSNLIPTGDLLREAVKKKEKLGKQAQTFMRKGELVPDEIILKLIKREIKEKGSERGFVLDGFPRTCAQAQGLGKVLKEIGKKIDAVVKLKISEKVAKERLSFRSVCPNCEANFNQKTKSPKKLGRCDFCGEKLEKRFDDDPQTISFRLKVYQKKTKPIEDYYKKRRILKVVDGNGEPEQVKKKILAILKKDAKIS